MKGQFLIKCDFSYSCAAADKISTDLRARAVSLRQLSYLLHTQFIDREFEFYEFFSFLKFNEFYALFSVEKNS